MNLLLWILTHQKRYEEICLGIKISIALQCCLTQLKRQRVQRFRYSKFHEPTQTQRLINEIYLVVHIILLHC